MEYLLIPLAVVVLVGIWYYFGRSGETEDPIEPPKTVPTPPEDDETPSEDEDGSSEDVEERPQPPALEDLDLDDHIMELLEDAGIETFGDLLQFSTENNYVDIHGIGPARAEKIEKAMEEIVHVK